MLYLSCQRYKSKAIHNRLLYQNKKQEAVFIMSKIQIESNSQQLKGFDKSALRCIYHVKDTNRKQFTTYNTYPECYVWLYLSCQRYKSKAIHNWMIDDNWSSIAVFIMSKIQIESNSQHHLIKYQKHWSCIYHVKDTNRKQFTTKNSIFIGIMELYLSCQRYKSKAIHNRCSERTAVYLAVFIMSKIQIESNSQLT